MWNYKLDCGICVCLYHSVTLNLLSPMYTHIYPLQIDENNIKDFSIYQILGMSHGALLRAIQFLGHFYITFLLKVFCLLNPWWVWYSLFCWFLESATHKFLTVGVNNLADPGFEPN